MKKIRQRKLLAQVAFNRTLQKIFKCVLRVNNGTIVTFNARKMIGEMGTEKNVIIYY